MSSSPSTSGALLRTLSTTSYTFADFLARLSRSSSRDLPTLYQENRVLFEQREDLLQRAVSALSWEKAATLVSVAQYHQPVAVRTYRALLGTMLAHNRRRGADSLVSWRAALQTVTETYRSHGLTVPSRVALSGFRLIAPHRRWYEAICLLQFAQANDQLSLPMLIDAAGSCATADHWRTALELLGRVHRQQPHRLLQAVQSLIPTGSSDALLAPVEDEHAVSDRQQREHVQRVLGQVVCAVPEEEFVRNELCLSYLTHLCASPQVKDAALREVLNPLSWHTALRLLSHTPVLQALNRQDDTILIAGEDPGALQDSSTALDVHAPRPVGSKERRWGAAVLAVVLEKLPTTKAANSFLESVQADRSVTRDTRVASAMITVACRCADVDTALQWVSLLQHPLPVAVASDLVELLHKSQRALEAATVVLPVWVHLEQSLTGQSLVRLFELILLHNTNAAGSGGESLLSWEAALSWSTRLCPQAWKEDPSQTDPRMITLLLHLCVHGQSAQGALAVLSKARSEWHLRVGLEKEARALLFCMQYGRRLEAAALVENAQRVHGEDAAKPLVELIRRGKTMLK